MRRVGIGALLIATVALAMVDRAAAGPAAQLYPIDLKVDGGEDAWHPSNFFRLEWDRPPIADQGFPVTAVGYRVRDAAGAVAIGERRLAGDRSLIGSLRVPPVPGVYTADVWLEGPDGERGPAVSAALRYDGARPGIAWPLAPEGWIPGNAPATVSIRPPVQPLPISGIRGYAVSVDRDGEIWPCATRDWCGDADTDLGGGIADTVLSLGILPEGVSVVRAVAVSGAGIPSLDAGSAVVRVDATPPEVTLAGVPSGWVDGPVRVMAAATDSLSGMAANGAFTAIAVDAGVPRTEPGGSAAVTVTGEGTHRVASYARDAAGNVGDRWPRTATVSIDESPPRVKFARAQDPANPERIEATVADSASAADPMRGSIAVRAASSDQRWQPLATEVSAGELVARWDSDSHPPGTYEFRATGYDAAGNVAVSSDRADHTKMVLVSPLKRAVRLRAALAGFPRSTARRAPYGRRIVYGGRLASAAGSPLGGLPVRIVESFGPGAAPPQRSTEVLTARDGTFAVRLPPGPSRQVQALFAGTRALSRASGAPAGLEVLTGVRLRASMRTARIGGAPVVFRGRVGALGAAIPADGLPVELQFRVPGGEWAEFRTVPTDARGRYRYAYAFSDDDSRGVRFQFRAYVNGGGWPYEPAASDAVTVTGR